MTRDGKIEAGFTLAVIVALLLFLFYHKGKGSASTDLPNVIQQDQDVARDYNPAFDIPNGFNLGDVNFNYPLSTTDANNLIEAGALIPPVPFNMSTGTPQCGCTASAPVTTDLNFLLPAPVWPSPNLSVIIENVTNYAPPVIRVNQQKPQFDPTGERWSGADWN